LIADGHAGYLTADCLGDAAILVRAPTGARAAAR
jgi:hypothetical protein